MLHSLVRQKFHFLDSPDGHKQHKKYSDEQENRRYGVSSEQDCSATASSSSETEHVDPSEISSNVTDNFQGVDLSNESLSDIPEYNNFVDMEDPFELNALRELIGQLNETENGSIQEAMNRYLDHVIGDSDSDEDIDYTDDELSEDDEDDDVVFTEQDSTLGALLEMHEMIADTAFKENNCKFDPFY